MDALNCAGKLKTLKTILQIKDSSQDDDLTVYLDMAREEILNWMYINYADKPEDVEVPAKYDGVIVQAVVAGLNMQGGENQFKHVENGITREWHYTDMLEYIRAHVNQIPRIG